MELDFAALSPRDRYKMLSGFIIPRPIAWVTTCDADGRANAAPFSFFNVFGKDPAVVAMGLQRPGGQPKDTERNIVETGEFVVNMVVEGLAEAMNVCATDFPPEVDEVEVAGLSMEPSHAVKPGRIAQSPVAFECRYLQGLDFGNDYLLALGEVVWMRVADGLLDPETMRIVGDAYRPIARLYGDFYAHIDDRFSLPRMTLAEWEATKAKGD